MGTTSVNTTQQLMHQVRQAELRPQFEALLYQGLTRATIEAAIKDFLKSEQRAALTRPEPPVPRFEPRRAP